MTVFPNSFSAGPTEGAVDLKRQVMPSEFEDILEKNLKKSELTPQLAASLVNLCGVFDLETDKLEQCIAVIRKAANRFPSTLEVERRNSLIFGLARVASLQRSKALANEVRIIVRKVRIDNLSRLSADDEFICALKAAGAFTELGDWINFVSDWANELAFSDLNNLEASNLLSTLHTLCKIEPLARPACGRAVSALSAFIGR